MNCLMLFVFFLQTSVALKVVSKFVETTNNSHLSRSFLVKNMSFAGSLYRDFCLFYFRFGLSHLVFT